MKPITGTLLRYGKNVESMYRPVCLVYENENWIATEDRDGDCMLWKKSNGNTFERDKWRVFSQGKPAGIFDPYTILSETDKYYILCGTDGIEMALQKDSYELSPYPHKIEITCKINGKEVPLSKVSEETLLNIRKESNG